MAQRPTIATNISVVNMAIPPFLNISPPFFERLILSTRSYQLSEKANRLPFLLPNVVLTVYQKSTSCTRTSVLFESKGDEYKKSNRIILRLLFHHSLKPMILTYNIDLHIFFQCMQSRIVPVHNRKRHFFDQLFAGDFCPDVQSPVCKSNPVSNRSGYRRCFH